MSDVRIEARIADITTLDVDAIVNAANSGLAPGGGVCGVIHRAAGPELAAACGRLAPCPTGEARMMPGFRLPARFVIHAVGPVWQGGSHGESGLLASAYRASLRLAREAELQSIAFPAISTGIYGYPLSAATKVAVSAVREELTQPGTARDIRVLRPEGPGRVRGGRSVDGHVSTNDEARSEQAAYDELQCYTLAHGDPAFIHQHVVDAFAAQHATGETKPIAITFALVGLYLHVERGFSGRQVQRTHMALARQRQRWPSFPLPQGRGSLTAVQVMAERPGPDRDRAIDAWCRSVWEAFRESHQAVADLLRQHGIA